ncbi:MAG TPA: CaiB/BaiF CoA-transferase family protein [Hyphomicrobiales bacterium]|nr:CaiB/BaiF CoA-transferase family protein [Hyphomicrobiales bacterium]
MRPFEGIQVVDLTHVLAGPFATYQLAVFGADVIKIEMPHDPDQTRLLGADRALSAGRMGTYFLAQGANKRSMTVDLKTEPGRKILKKLVARADVMVENYRPGAMAALGLGHEDMAKLNPRLIYVSMSAFGQNGPRGTQTAYDPVIQATSGLMAATGTPETSPLRMGTSAVDYASGTMGAFAIAAALFQRERTGQGQYVDMAMLDVAMILMGTHVTGHLRNGWQPKPTGNKVEVSTNCLYEASDGPILLAASNLRQQKRLWAVLGRPDMAKSTNEERRADYAREVATLTEIMKTRTAQEWEDFLQANHVPAARIWTLAETLLHPQLATRDVLHGFAGAPGVAGPFAVPKAAFKLAHGGAEIESPPPRFGEHNDVILTELGYGADEIEALRAAGVIGVQPD